MMDIEVGMEIEISFEHSTKALELTVETEVGMMMDLSKLQA